MGVPPANESKLNTALAQAAEARVGFSEQICGIIERLEDVHQRTLARSALVRTCMKKQPREEFTVAGIPRPALT